jgi:prepilin-type N-terminal cleavage/methylation domain-containing protein
MLKNKQQGFTLLELLVVITLLAVLSVGALVAYEGIGENASNVAAANNIKTADSSIRAYRAIENVYPNQWDNLANQGGELSGGAVDTLANVTKEFFGQVQINDPVTDTAAAAILRTLANVGVTELQTLTAAAVRPAGLAPNEFFNESAPGVLNPADEIEWAFDDTGAIDAVDSTAGPYFISTVTSGGDVADGANGACTATGTTGNLATNFNGTQEVGANGVGASRKLNRINDALDSDGCHLVFALGFGKDVPGTTLGSRVAISTAPTYTNGNVINPSVNYARFIALFHVGSADEDGATPTVVTTADLFPKARLLAVVDTEGRNIDTAIAGAFARNE